MYSVNVLLFSKSTAKRVRFDESASVKTVKKTKGILHFHHTIVWNNFMDLPYFSYP